MMSGLVTFQPSRGGLKGPFPSAGIPGPGARRVVMLLYRASLYNKGPSLTRVACPSELVGGSGPAGAENTHFHTHRDTPLSAVASHMAERSGGNESHTTHGSPTPKSHVSLLLTCNWPHPTARRWGSTDLRCAQEKSQKSDDSLHHCHGPALIHKVTPHVSLIRAYLEMSQGLSIPQDHKQQVLGILSIKSERCLSH